MRGILLLLTVFLSVVNLFLLVREKPANPEKIEIITTETVVYDMEEKPVEPPIKIESTFLPQPIVISNLLDLSKIDDLTLKAFAMRQTEFRNEKILYFVWKGKSNEKLQGQQISDEKKYVLTLIPGSDDKEVTHRQIFVIPQNYDYSVVAAK
jgi:hypothetical protein